VYRYIEERGEAFDPERAKPMPVATRLLFGGLAGRAVHSPVADWFIHGHHTACRQLAVFRLHNDVVKSVNPTRGVVRAERDVPS
jgi:hypothetical protein